MLLDFVKRTLKGEHARRFIMFALVGGFGTVINLAIFYALYSQGAVHYLIASVIATEIAIICNFLGNNFITFRDKKAGGILRKFISFQFISLTTIIGTSFFLWAFVNLFGESLILLWNLSAIGIMFVANFFLNSRFTWTDSSAAKEKIVGAPATPTRETDTGGKLLAIAAVLLILSASLVAAQDLVPVDNSTNNGTINASAIDNPVAGPVAAPLPATGDLIVVSVPPQVEVSIAGSTFMTDATGTGSVSGIDVGQYPLTATKEGYENYSTTILIEAGTNTLGIVLTPVTPPTPTSNLTIITDPNNVNVMMDNVPQGNTGSNRRLQLTGLAPGTHVFGFSKQDYVSVNQTVTLLAGENQLQAVLEAIELPPMPPPIPPPNATLPPNRTSNTTNNTNSTNSTPTNSTNTTNSTSTNTTINTTTPGNGAISSATTTLSPTGGSYYMREDGSATFSVALSAPAPVTWFIDGVQQKADGPAASSTFTWEPGVLWVPRAPDYGNMHASTVKAVSGSTEVSWNVNVENVVNPFFSSANDGADIVGSTDSKIHVFTNNKLVIFSNLSATVTSGGSAVSYQLVKLSDGPVESDWSFHIAEMPGGNSYLSSVTGFDTLSGTVKTYSFGDSRAHYRTTTSSGGSGGSSGGGGGGSGLSTPRIADPELVYVMFEKGLATVNDTQTLKLDAKNFKGGVARVEAQIFPPAGTPFVLPLERTSGSKEYGTWAVNFTRLKPGRYNLMSIRMSPYENGTMKQYKVLDTSFYVSSGVARANSSLDVIYTSLSASNVKNGTTVKMMLDAADKIGVASVQALVTSNRGDNQTITMKRVKGNAQYGTWEGNFTVHSPDTTYTWNSVTLSNKNDTETVQVKDRSVYVDFIPYVPPQVSASVLSPFSGEYWSNKIKEPLVPTLIGFGLMLLIAILVLQVWRSQDQDMDAETEAESETPSKAGRQR